MKLRKLYTLLVLWCFLVLAPGATVALGVFGRMDMNSNISGVVVLPWILGYLAQLAIFMWIMSIVGEQKAIWRLLLWWFAASLLPWAVDWTLPVSLLFLGLWLAMVIALASHIAVVARNADSLQQRGIRAIGVVLEVLKPWMNVVVNNVYIKRKLRLRIEREDGAPAYEGTLNGLFMLGEIPSPGDRIPVVVDPAKPQHLDYDKGASSVRAMPSRATATYASNHGIADELAKLAALHERGTLTDSEFVAAKKKLLHPG